MRFHKLVLALVVSACLFHAYGCKTFQASGLPVIFALDVNGEGAHPAAGRSDGRTTVLRYDGDVTVAIYDKSSGLPIVAHQMKKGETLVISRPRDFKRTYKAGDALPFWVVDLFPDGGREKAALLGFLIEAAPASTRTASP